MVLAPKTDGETKMGKEQIKTVLVVIVIVVVVVGILKGFGL